MRGQSVLDGWVSNKPSADRGQEGGNLVICLKVGEAKDWREGNIQSAGVYSEIRTELWFSERYGVRLKNRC